MKEQRTAMIFAAGLGTRLQPLTNYRPKALVEIEGRPLIEIQLERLYQTGWRRIIVNIHHFPDMMKEWISAYHRHPDMEILISDESDHLLNTGGGLKKAASQIGLTDGYPLLVHNVDILDNADMNVLDSHFTSNTDAILIVSNRNTQRYLLFDKDNRLVGWTHTGTGEIRTPYKELDLDACRKMAFAGIHIIGSRAIATMQDYPDAFSIIDFYIRECNQLVIKGYNPPQLAILDVGKPEALQKATSFYHLYYS